MRGTIEYVAGRTDSGTGTRGKKTATLDIEREIAGSGRRHSLPAGHCGGDFDVYGSILAIHLAAYRCRALPVLLAHLLAGRRRGETASRRTMRVPASFLAGSISVPRAAARIPAAHAADLFARAACPAGLLSNDLRYFNGVDGRLHLLAAAALRSTWRGAGFCRVHAYRRVGHCRSTLRPRACRAYPHLRYCRQPQALDLRLYHAGSRLPAENLPAALPARPVYRGTTGRPAFLYAAAARHPGIFAC